MIKIENLYLRFDDKLIFENASLEIPDSNITMIVGANGTGKTSLLKVISGIIRPNNESIVYNSFREKFFLPQSLKYPEDISLFDYLSSAFFKNVFKWFLDRYEKIQIEKVLYELDLFDRRDVLMQNLSSGERQKANIAMALLSEADCLLLDEPTSNMDLINQIKILNLVRNLLEKNITSIIAIHDLNLAAAYGDYFVGISRSNSIIQKNKNDFFSKENLENIFGINFEVSKNNEKFHVQIDN